MNTLIIFTILALAAPIFGDESLEVKKQEKRGIVNLGYGGHYPYAGHGYSGYAPYAGFGHGYVPSAYPHGVGYGWNHGVASSIGHGSVLAPYSHAYQSPSVYSALPWRGGYNGYNSGYNHGYINGW